MNKNPDLETPPVAPDEHEGTPELANAEAARDTGLLASLKHAKDFVVDKVSHPTQTADEAKAWAERSAHTVDAALEGVQGSLASVHTSIGQAREWTSDRAAQVDRILAGVQDVVTRLDDSVETAQGATHRVADSLHPRPEMDCTPPAERLDEADVRPEPPESDAPESDGAWGARPDRPER